MGRRKTPGRKRGVYKQLDSADEDEQLQLIQQTNAAQNTVPQELHSLPCSSRQPTQSNNVEVAEANMQSHIVGEQEDEITTQPLQKVCELNREDSLNLTDLVQKLNKNVTDPEEVASKPHTALVTVAGYRVKGEVAPFLREILSEHGDIASECILQTSESRASLLESVCMIYQELEPTFPNISSIEVDKMQARIKDLEIIRLNVGCLYKRLEEISTLKGLLAESKSLHEAGARCKESIETKEKYLEVLEEELLTVQQKISSEKDELALLKAEAERIEASFETMARITGLPEKCTISMTGTSAGQKLGEPMQSREVLERDDAQLQSQTESHHNNQCIAETNENLSENDGPQAASDSMPSLKTRSCNRQSLSQSDHNSPNLRAYFRRSRSQPESLQHNPEPRLFQSNLLARSDLLPNSQNLSESNSENGSDKNYEISSDDGNNMNTVGADYAPGESPNSRGTHNQGSNFGEFSRKRVRGKTTTLRGWGMGKKMMLQFNEHNEVIGKLAAPFASQLGVLARDGKKLPLTYTDWRAVPEVYKERLWQEVKDNTNLQDDSKKAIFKKLAKMWKSWKWTVKELYFNPYRNDNEKLALHPPDARVEKDQWPILVRFWNSKAALEIGKQNKIVRKERTRFHRTGRMGYANFKEKLKERGLESDMIDMIDLSSIKIVQKPPVDFDAGENMENSKDDRVQDQVLEEEAPDRVDQDISEMTPSQILTGSKMKLPAYQRKAFDLAVKAQVDQVVGNMRETMTAELAEMFSGMKQTWMSGVRGHMAFAVPFDNTQAPESSRVQPTPSYVENNQREGPNRNSSFVEVGSSKKRKNTL